MERMKISVCVNHLVAWDLINIRQVALPVVAVELSDTRRTFGYRTVILKTQRGI